jgi:hypothetical protein
MITRRQETSMNPYPSFYRHIAHTFGAAAMMLMALTAGAQQHAHTHGQLALNVAVDAQAITFQIESPLDNFLGFEHAPRTNAERKRVSDMAAQFNAADRLFQPDPKAGCTLAKVELNSAMLGLAHVRKKHDHHHGHDEHGRTGGEKNAHADIDVLVVFSCPNAAAARFIDVNLFNAFKHIRTIDAQVATAQGQFKRSLKRGTSRIDWGR